MSRYDDLQPPQPRDPGPACAPVDDELGDDYRAALDALVGDEPPLELHVVTLGEFAAVDEPGAEPIVGDQGDIVIPVGGYVMIYGDGGAGKTTLGLDLACHLGTACDWLVLSVPTERSVIVVENEGPRPLFRDKVSRKLDAWPGAISPRDRVHIVDEPWAKLNLAREPHRAALAKAVADLDADLVIIGPLATSGMLGAGTLQEVRDFLAFCDDVRNRSGRPVTFIVIHHENKGGKVSGAWEGAGDTLLHVSGMGPGRTRVYFQKVRWSKTWHAQTLDLRWSAGEGFEVDDKPEISDDDLETAILAVVAANPGTSWSMVDKAVKGCRAERKREIRTRLLAVGELVNIITENGVEVAVDHCPEKKRSRFHLGADPTIAHLRPNPDADGTQSEFDLG